MREPSGAEYEAMGIVTDEDGNVGLRVASPIGLFLFGSLVMWSCGLVFMIGLLIYRVVELL